MRRRLPPLNAIRAFEAAGRNQSFTRAADELLVTPGAISRQVRTLEDQLGIQLFERNHREVKLTRASESYCAQLTEVFDHIERITKRVSADSSLNRELHVYCSMTFTLRWLLPRLNSFHAQFPQQELRLTATLPKKIDLLAGDIDVAITSFLQTDESIVQHKLIDIDFLPVCSPKLLAGLTKPISPATITKFTMLDSLARPGAWEAWFKSAGIEPPAGSNTVYFESSTLAYEAAIAGLGFAIGMKALVKEDLEAGRLVAPFGHVLQNGGAFYLVYPSRVGQQPQVKRFRTWILAEAAKATV